MEGNWLYINYKKLKNIIAIMRVEKESSDSEDIDRSHFETAVLDEIAKVDGFFKKTKAKFLESSTKSLEDESSQFENMQKLHKYAILNYLAVLKIVKKYDKHFSPVRPKICKVLMKTKFYEAVNSPSLFESLHKGWHGDSKHECPICLEGMRTPVALTCGHEFCWVCLWKGDSENLSSCPLCRESQTLNPSERNINDILGGFSKKYFPRMLERKDHKNSVPKSKRNSCPDEHNFSSLKNEKSCSLTKESKYQCRKCTNNVGKGSEKYDMTVGSLTHIRNGLIRDLGKLKQPSVRANRVYTWPTQTCNETQIEDDGCTFQLEM